MRSLILFALFSICLVIILFNCNSEKESPFRNIHKEGASYVGMQECKTCHWQVYETFIKTGMGQSWDVATRAKSAADFTPSKALVYDSIKDFYYKPFWNGDSLFIVEYRLAGKDTVHKRLEKVSYIVGSGQHTNSHIININGYLHQAPITFYTQKGKWDLAPGFEKGKNSRFDRKIELECISCHNGYPVFDQGSLNKFSQIKTGIDCERCHGPGSIHVAEKRNGQIVDTSVGPDYSIVNPRRLSIDQQNSLCQRCHLQGVAVLNEGKSFFDFMPSDPLHNTMNVFMPNYGHDEKHMIMASHVERLKMSKCFVNSGKVSCITCHNPHVSVKFTPQEQYNTACKNCHHQGKDCTEKLAIRQAKNDECASCHMPKNGSIDIPHVAVTDHYIRRKPMVFDKNEIATFLGLKCYNQDQVKDRSMAKAYLEFYERYEENGALLDSALFYLKKAGVNVEDEQDADLIRVLFLQENYSKIVLIVKEFKPSDCKDAWTAYRIGTAYVKMKQLGRAVDFLKQATTLKPNGLDFQYKFGDALFAQHDIEAAQKVFEYIVAQNPRYTKAHSQLGYIYMQQNHLPQAIASLQTSIMLDPDQVQTLINLSVCYYKVGQRNKIKPLLLHALKLDPSNVQIKSMLADLAN